MTDLDQLVHTLPMQAKIALLQIRQDPMTAVPAVVPASLSMLLHQGLVNARDGRLTISQRGMTVLRAMDTDQQIETCDRFLRIVANVLACGGEVRNLEQAFTEPNFTESDLDMFAACVEQLRAAIEQAGRSS